MNKNYVTGRRKEYEVKQMLEKAGFAATRAAGSKGVFDIIAYNSKVVRFIQVKYEKSPVSYAADIAKMTKITVPQFCVKELWVYTRTAGWNIVVVGNNQGEINE
jgi:Holliday junction resolvase